MNKPKLKTNVLYLSLNALVLVAVLILIYAHFSQNDSIVYVDSGKILSEYKGAIVAKTAFDTKANLWKANIDTLTQEVQESLKNYERNLAKMNRLQQEETKNLINAKRRQLVEYQKAVQENAGKENTKIMEPVIVKLNQFLLSYGKAHHHKMILIANQSGTIAYAKEGLDVTSEVIEALNKSYNAAN